MGCSPWGRKESGTTEQSNTHTHYGTRSERPFQTTEVAIDTGERHKEKGTKDFLDLFLYKIHTVDVQYRQNDNVSTLPRGKPGNHYYQISDKVQNKAPYSRGYGFFPAVMYRCKSWTIKKAECRRIDAFEPWC